MAAPDPVDVRLLTAVAEMGRAGVYEIAARLGMDVREVAARLAALSTTGLPLVVGVECDQQGIRNALAAANAWVSQHSGKHQVYGPSSGGYATPQAPGGYPTNAPQSGPHRTGPSGPYPAGPNGPQPTPPPGYPGPVPPPGPGAPAPGRPDPMNTWGPPGSAAWARGDQQPSAPPARSAGPPTGTVGSTLDGIGPAGEPVAINLVEVVDPADFLFTAAGYQLQPGERSVVVHTELTNRASVPFGSVPDLSLVLVATDGTTISKAPVSLSSRPPHRAGAPPGETAGGHTVYVLPDSTELVAIRWAPRPDTEQYVLTWDITDL